ncbi:hypothetical protein NBRC111894_1284 [Sporolactobacillus inulinus]|uniref:Uncharacterized protein n=1 Tax=Sporolactobacillus inulinus TaxID=2078 RepID=A0A4Y1Z9M4_9BACL|nr:hypothetical protein NBRC111894_1284 [Sporolactobacillus inulinus]
MSAAQQINIKKSEEGRVVSRKIFFAGRSGFETCIFFSIFL